MRGCLHPSFLTQAGGREEPGHRACIWVGRGRGPLPTPAGGEVGTTGSVMASTAPRKAGLPGPVPIGEGAPSPQADGQGLLRWEL